MTTASPHLADPFDTDPELLSRLRDHLLDIERAQGPARVLQLQRLEWFVREQIAQGIAEGIAKQSASSTMQELAHMQMMEAIRAPSQE